MKFKALVFLLFLLPIPSWAQFSVSGYIYDAKDKESLPSATIQDTTSKHGVSSNSYGFFSINVNAEYVVLLFSYVGYESQILRVDARSNELLEIVLEEKITEMEDVVVSAQRSEVKDEVQSTRMSSISLKPVELKRIPSFAGESDILKIAQLMPGITQGNEGSTGMYVRGGTDDQNLILLDEAVVYNVGHLLGFFSVFNSDALKDIELMKGAFPAKYGGRLSSVMDIRMNEGSMERWNVKGGIGLLTSRLNIDGPIIKNKMSFMLAARRTYIDKVLQLAGSNLPYYFYDINGKMNYKLSNRDRIYLSAYLGSDVLYANGESETDEGIDSFGLGFDLGNLTTSLRWNHVYESGKLFSNVSIHQTSFQYSIFGNTSDNSLSIESNIQDYGFKADWEWFPITNHRVYFGLGLVKHQFQPNVLNTSGEINEFIASKAGPQLQSDEYHIHTSHEWDLGSLIKLNYGVRFSGAFVNTHYYGLEPRFSARYSLSSNHSLKIGFSTMRQYMHRVSSGSFVLPTDLWYPVTENVKPQTANQLSLGYFGATPKSNYSWSIEVFSKTMNDLIDYKEGASLIFNDNFEKELLSGSGKSEGIEFFLRKHEGKVSGWLSYTLAKTDRYFPELNNGNRFPDRFDRRHNISAVAMIELAPNVITSFTWVYMSGTKITAQTGQYLMPNPSLTGIDLVPIYSSKNGVTLAPSHRLDINLIIKGRARSWGQSEWNFSIYNFYNAASPFRVSIGQNGNALAYQQHGLFGFIPSISYNFSFSSK
jgi:hypothetical protein